MLEDAKKRMAENVICNLKKRNMEGFTAGIRKNRRTLADRTRCFHRLGRLGIDPGAGNPG